MFHNIRIAMEFKSYTYIIRVNAIYSLSILNWIALSISFLTLLCFDNTRRSVKGSHSQQGQQQQQQYNM